MGTASPDYQLHVVEDGGVSVIAASSDVSADALASRLALGNSVGTARFTVNMKGGSNEVAYLGSEGSFPIYFQTAGTERLRLAADGTATFAGTVETNERTITAGAFDLSTGNHWTCGAITVPAPTNATAGTSGLIRITAGPVVWNGVFKFPGGAAPTIAAFPAIIPFYVQSGSEILMGNVAEGIA